jgi:hypothetical protein
MLCVLSIHTHVHNLWMVNYKKWESWNCELSGDLFLWSKLLISCMNDIFCVFWGLICLDNPALMRQRWGINYTVKQLDKRLEKKIEFQILPVAEKFSNLFPCFFAVGKRQKKYLDVFIYNCVVSAAVLWCHRIMQAVISHQKISKSDECRYVVEDFDSSCRAV